MVVKETRRKHTILLVEDDRELREYMQRFLEDLGYLVAVATDEADSLRLVDAEQTQIQLILLNQRMLSDAALAAGGRLRSAERYGKTLFYRSEVIAFRPEKGGRGRRRVADR